MALYYTPHFIVEDAVILLNEKQKKPIWNQLALPICCYTARYRGVGH